MTQIAAWPPVTTHATLDAAREARTPRIRARPARDFARFRRPRAG